MPNKRLAIFGFSFKANTNDTRESPSIFISKDLLQEGAQLTIFDPKVNEKQILTELQGMIKEQDVIVCDSHIQASKGADAILVLTEWEEFKNLNWEPIYKIMRKPAWIFDARNFLKKEKLRDIGFKTWTLGDL